MPFAEFFGVARQAAAAREAAWAAAVEPIWTRHQSRLSECMTAAGFEYQPVDPPKPGVVDLPTGTDVAVPWLPETRDQVQLHGYGLMDPPSAQPDPTGQEERQNLEYVESLSAQGRAEYEEALTGHTGDLESYGQAGGCVAEAAAQTDYLARYTQIQFDLETAYVAAHRAELDKMVATWQDRQG
jgi:hypothetical protein